MAELADAADSKSAEVHPSWGFDPPSRHQYLIVCHSDINYVRGFFATLEIFLILLVSVLGSVGTSMSSTAACSVLGARWAYRAVMAIVLCPARVWIVFKGTLAIASREQNVCRLSCQ